MAAVPDPLPSPPASAPPPPARPTRTWKIDHLITARFFPPVGVPLHVNQPWHEGDTPLHDHDFVEIAVVVAGRGIHRTIHGEQAIGVGDAFVLHPGQWHAYERSRGLLLYNCCVGVSLLAHELSWARAEPRLAPLFPARLPAQGTRPATGQGIIHLKIDRPGIDALVGELETLRTLQRRNEPLATRAASIAHLILVLDLVATRLSATPGVHRIGAPDPVVTAAIQAMEERLDHPWGLVELARAFRRNRSYLVRLFQRHTGSSPMAWLARRRAEKAAVLLLTTAQPIADIGRAVGWHDPNYFARRFRSVFGVTASAYRAQLPMPAALPQADDWIQW